MAHQNLDFASDAISMLRLPDNPLQSQLLVPSQDPRNCVVNTGPPFRKNLKHAAIAYYIHYTNEGRQERAQKQSS